MARCLRQQECDYIRNNYTLIKDVLDESGNCLKPEIEKHNWEVVYNENGDSKYGRFAICKEEKLYRTRISFSEFYGGGVVD